MVGFNRLKRNENNERDGERGVDIQLTRQERKLVGVYATEMSEAGVDRCLFGARDYFPSEGEKERAFAFIYESDPQELRLKERDLLGEIKPYEGGSSEFTPRADLRFLRQYPTPFDFEEEFSRIPDDQKADVEKRLKNVYGKKYEYYLAIRGLHAEANRFYQEKEEEARRLERERVEKRGLFRGIGQRVRGMVAKEKERTVEILALDVGVYDWEKNSIQGYENSQRVTEDTSYIDENRGIFGVFDGAGGVGGYGAGGVASRTAKEYLRERFGRQLPESPSDLADALTGASREVAEKTEGVTTATVARLVQENGKRFLDYAQAGDSRLYVVHNGNARQITQDEGYGRYVFNWLGAPHGSEEGYIADDGRSTKVIQCGRVEISSGDRIVLCSDGITGDTKDEEMREEELGRIVEDAGHVQSAARALVERAKKIDDRTAVVVQTS